MRSICALFLFLLCLFFFSFFFFNDTATTEIYTLSLHDALPISWRFVRRSKARGRRAETPSCSRGCRGSRCTRSEEHTSELQSRVDLVCRLLLEKKKKKKKRNTANKTEHHREHVVLQ